MDIKLLNIQTFCLTYELGGFTQAARALGVTPQAASRSVARLEQTLGVVLFRRNTRQVRPTDAGRQYYESCRRALGILQEATERVKGDHEEPAGEVRVSVPTTYGHHRFIPMLGRFRQKHPRVSVDVQVSNTNVDFVRDGFDLAIRMGRLDDASFVARRLGLFSLGVFASPDYLSQHSAPQTLDDLQHHECAVFVMPRTGRLLPWSFENEPTVVLPNASVHIRDDVLGLVSFARAGCGLVQMYRFLVERELASGALVEVLQQHKGVARPFSLIYPRQTSQRPAVRVLIDHIVEASQNDKQPPTTPTPAEAPHDR